MVENCLLYKKERMHFSRIQFYKIEVYSFSVSGALEKWVYNSNIIEIARISELYLTVPLKRGMTSKMATKITEIITTNFQSCQLSLVTGFKMAAGGQDFLVHRPISFSSISSLLVEIEQKCIQANLQRIEFPIILTFFKNSSFANNRVTSY